MLFESRCIPPGGVTVPRNSAAIIVSAPCRLGRIGPLGSYQTLRHDTSAAPQAPSRLPWLPTMRARGHLTTERVVPRAMTRADGWRGLRERRRVGGYAELAPPRDLLPCVEAVWTYRTPDDGPPPQHRVLPHVGVSLCLEYRTRGADAGDIRALLLGPVRESRIFEPERGLVMEAVQLHPEWSRALLGVAPEDHTDRLDDWCDVRPRQAAELTGRAEEAVAAGRAPLPGLLSWLSGRWQRCRTDPATRLAHAALRRLRGEVGGQGRVEAVARELGVSPRHLRRVVGAVAGRSPKSIHRVERLNRAVAEGDATVKPRWAAVAAGHGYFDQAHLIREFRELVGFTPTDLHTERRTQRVRFFQAGEGAQP